MSYFKIVSILFIFGAFVEGCSTEYGYVEKQYAAKVKTTSEGVTVQENNEIPDLNNSIEHEWTLVSGTKKDGFSISIPFDVTPTFSFTVTNTLNEKNGSDHAMAYQLSGNAGCNRIFGNAEINDKNIKVSPLAMTRKSCGKERNAFEYAVAKLLENSSSFELSFENLTLRDDSGSSMLRFKRPIEKKLLVASQKSPCFGMAQSECLQVKSIDDESYSLFYDQINGFDFEAGFEYELLVKVNVVVNPPADASNLSYDLVEVISKLLTDNSED